jgi:hypothetical protein
LGNSIEDREIAMNLNVTGIAVSPGALILLGVIVVMLAMIGRGGSRGPATGLPLTLLLVVGAMMILIGIISLLNV